MLYINACNDVITNYNSTDIVGEAGLNGTYVLENETFSGMRQWKMPDTRSYIRYSQNESRWEIHVIHPPKGSTYFYNNSCDSDVPPEQGWTKTDLADPKDNIQVSIEKQTPSPPRRKWRAGGGVRWRRGGNKNSPQSQRLASLQAKLDKKKNSPPPSPPPTSNTNDNEAKPKRKWKPGSTVSWSRKKKDSSKSTNETLRTLQAKRAARFQVTRSWKQRIQSSPKQTEKSPSKSSPSKRVRFADDNNDEEDNETKTTEKPSSPRVRFENVPKKEKPVPPPRKRRSTPHFKRNQRLVLDDCDSDDEFDDLPIRVSKKAMVFDEDMPETKVPPVKQSPEMIQRSIDFLSGKNTSTNSAPLPREMDLEECLRAVRLALADLRALRDEVQAQ